MLKYTWSQTRPDLRYSEINSKVESPVRVAIRNRGSERAIGKSGPEGKQVFYLRTKQKSRHRALGDSKRTWSDGKTTPVARCCEVSRNPRTYRARRYVKLCTYALVGSAGEPAIKLKFKGKIAYLLTTENIFCLNRVFWIIPPQKREKSRFLFPQVFQVPQARAQNYSKFESG